MAFKHSKAISVGEIERIDKLLVQPPSLFNQRNNRKWFCNHARINFPSKCVTNQNQDRSPTGWFGIAMNFLESASKYSRDSRVFRSIARLFATAHAFSHYAHLCTSRARAAFGEQRGDGGASLSAATRTALTPLCFGSSRSHAESGWEWATHIRNLRPNLLAPPLHSKQAPHALLHLIAGADAPNREFNFGLRIFPAIWSISLPRKAIFFRN